MTKRGKYKTKQRALVEECLAANADRYLTVDAVLALLSEAGQSVGRTTVYRTVELLAQEGRALKATSPGGESSYRLASGEGAGQLVCLDCGKALPLDCSMLGELSEHVSSHHGFSIEGARTVLYGHCAACEENSQA